MAVQETSHNARRTLSTSDKRLKDFFRASNGEIREKSGSLTAKFVAHEKLNKKRRHLKKINLGSR